MQYALILLPVVVALWGPSLFTQKARTMPLHTVTPAKRVTPILDREDLYSEYDAHASLMQTAQRHAMGDDPLDYCDAFEYSMRPDYN